MTTEQTLVAGRLVVAGLLCIGGALAIWFGYRLFAAGTGLKKDGTTITVRGKMKIVVGTVGGGLMLTSCLWGWFAKTTASMSLESNGEMVKISAEIPENQTFWVSSGSDKLLACAKKLREITCAPATPGQKCGAAPPLMDGLGRLEVSRVTGLSPESQSTVSANEASQLRDVFYKRGRRDWALRVATYQTRVHGKDSVRVVLNGVAPDVELPMCSWLKCEGWTFGPCKMVSAPSDSPDEPDAGAADAGLLNTHG